MSLTDNTRIVVFPTSKSQPVIKHTGTAYSSTHLDAVSELRIDARGDRIYLAMEEYRPESNRSHGVSMTIPRELWETFKKQMQEYDGSIL